MNDVIPTPDGNREVGCAAMPGYAAEVVAAVTAYDAALKTKTDYWIKNVCGFRAERIPDKMDINHANEVAAHRALGRVIDAARLFAKHSDKPQATT